MAVHISNLLEGYRSIRRQKRPDSTTMGARTGPAGAPSSEGQFEKYCSDRNSRAGPLDTIYLHLTDICSSQMNWELLERSEQLIAEASVARKEHSVSRGNPRVRIESTNAQRERG